MSVERIVETVAGVAPEVRAGLPGRRVYGEAENPSGEQQLAADVYADDLLEERLLALDSVASYASEERDEVVESEAQSASEHSSGERSEPRESDAAGEYHLACDPLDGSSNLKSNNAMGTIFAVYDEPLPAPGTSLVASGYVLYGPITTLMLAHEGTVTEYVVESEARSASVERTATEGSREQGDGTGVALEAVEEDLTLPEDPVVYGFGGRVPDWTDDFEAYAREIETELKLRYGGAMIADVNQVLTYGGVFAYPGLESRAEGKLRLQFEGAPIAYVVESAGGASSDGDVSLLEKRPGELHERTPVHVGNQPLIDRLEGAME
jgi:fructose-1,6-bisphosphatase I